MVDFMLFLWWHVHGVMIQNQVCCASFFTWTELSSIRIANTWFGACLQSFRTPMSGIASFPYAFFPTTVWVPMQQRNMSTKLWPILWHGHYVTQLRELGRTEGFAMNLWQASGKKWPEKPLALGWKGCYFGFRFDEKARKEVNFFYRSYQHGLVCMRCMSQRMHKNWIPELSYKNMDENAAHRMTTVSLLLSCC